MIGNISVHKKLGMHASMTSTLVGLSVWLLGLTAAILGKNYLDRHGKRTYGWIPLASYLSLSFIALVVAGIWYRRHHRGDGSVDMAAMLPKEPKAMPSAPPRAAPAKAAPSDADWQNQPPAADTSDASTDFDYGGM